MGSTDPLGVASISTWGKTYFWALAGFSGFSGYGMIKSIAESGFWRSVPNLVLISFALEEGEKKESEHT